MAIMPIAWTQMGDEKLTTDLALWWLGMLALSGSDKCVVTKKEGMTRIHERMGQAQVQP